MNKKQFSILLASMMAVHSVAFSATFQTPVEALKTEKDVSLSDLTKIVNPATEQSLMEMIETYRQVQQLSVNLKAIQDGNEKDFFLRNSKKIQVGLVAASSIALTLHLKAADKKSLTMSLAAASALLNMVERHYAAVKNLDPSEMGTFLYAFTQDMQKNKMLTPEMIEMADSMNKISSDLLTQKTQIDSLVASLGGGSDIATGALIILSMAHFLAPKLAKDGEAILKTITQKVATGGVNLSQSSKVVGGTGVAAGIPDIVGMSLGMDAASSQKMMTLTRIQLDTAMRKLQAQIPEQYR